MLDSDAVTRYIDTNLFSLYLLAARVCDRPSAVETAYTYVDLAPCRWGRAVFDVHLSDPAALADLKEAVASGRVPNAVQTGPTSEPEDVEQRLEAQGFVRHGTGRGMTLDLAQLNPIPETPGFSCRLVESEQGLVTWSSIVTRNLFRQDESQAAPFTDVVRRLLGPQCLCVLGSLEGRAVTTGFLYMPDATVAGYYFVATEKEVRGRGCGASLTHYAMRLLQDRGIKHCILQATDLGKPVYERVGFRETWPLGRYGLPEG